MTRDAALSVLGLDVGASASEVSAAYRELAQMLHPDKYGDNKRLRARAEQHMRSLNEARAVLLGRRPSAASAPRSRASASASEQIAQEASARARAAETARLAVVVQLRTLRERRRGFMSLLVLSAAAMLICSRLRGTVAMLGFSISSMLLIWGAADAIALGNQISVLRRRSLELTKTRDAASEIARQAREL